MSKPSKKPARSRPTKARSSLLGLGLDNADGHKRVTTGEKFVLLGGSEETHARMTETVLKTFEELKRRDKQLETVEPKELAEIMHRAKPD